MRSRNEEGLNRKAKMKAGIMDVLIAQIAIIQAARERQIAFSTIQHYCQDSKTRVEAFLGDETFAKKPNFLRQYDNKDKSKVKLVQFRMAMKKVGSSEAGKGSGRILF